MKYTDEVDILYLLDKHGWSSCYLYVENSIYFLGPTHIFNHPIEELLNGLILMLRGEKECSFSWYDEPGEDKWFVKRNEEQHHKIQVSITECAKIESGKQLISETVEFEVKQKIFCYCVYSQMKKIYKLMSEKSYSEDRDFPYEVFKDFRREFSKKYS